MFISFHITRETQLDVSELIRTRLPYSEKERTEENTVIKVEIVWLLRPRLGAAQKVKRL
jgi:hypothetical protein